jgi:uncharacterized protein YegP (UPF0339 family)
MRGPAKITLDKDHVATRPMLCFFLAVALGGALAYYARYRRFARYKAWSVLLGAANILAEPAAQDGKGTEVASAAKFELYADNSGKYRWRLQATNGQTIASSGQSFASKSNAHEAAETVRRAAPSGEIVEA